MATAEQIASGNGFDETRQPIHQARHAPGGIYSSAEIYAREKELIFMRDWLAVARVEELEKPVVPRSGVRATGFRGKDRPLP